MSPVAVEGHRGTIAGYEVVRTSLGLVFSLMGIVVLSPACRQQKAGEAVEGTVLDTAGKPLAEVRVFTGYAGWGPVTACASRPAIPFTGMRSRLTFRR